LLYRPASPGRVLHTESLPVDNPDTHAASCGVMPARAATVIDSTDAQGAFFSHGASPNADP
jgi:hypothetical protein